MYGRFENRLFLCITSNIFLLLNNNQFPFFSLSVKEKKQKNTSDFAKAYTFAIPTNVKRSSDRQTPTMQKDAALLRLYTFY
jgi:hypothetical protein